MMRKIMLHKDFNTYFRKNDIVIIKQKDEKTETVLIYNRKNKKEMWIRFKDLY